MGFLIYDPSLAVSAVARMAESTARSKWKKYRPAMDFNRVSEE